MQQQWQQNKKDQNHEVTPFKYAVVMRERRWATATKKVARYGSPLLVKKVAAATSAVT